MNNLRMTAPAFEREKNIKAASYTATVCVLLLIIFFFAKWTLPVVTQPPVMEGIEVNLGNSDEGLGDVAPQIPGEPSASKDEQYTPPATSQPVPQEQNIVGDENEDDDAPVVNKAVKPVVRPSNTITPTAARPKPNTQPVADPTPAPPQPKAVYKGGSATGSGGNGADSYNNVRNQGIAGGNGDQGSAGGNPNSDSYKGNGGSGSSGVRKKSGLKGRDITRMPSFQDEFTQNATVNVSVTVDNSGRVTNATISLAGTTTPDQNIRT
jgi:outer membrane biosynthesis protein TonB